MTTLSQMLIVPGVEPVMLARRLRHLPGVVWVAVGFEFGDKQGRTKGLQVLANRYLRPGSTFRLLAKVADSDEEEGDVLLEGTGAVLKAVKGTKVEEKTPEVTFRVAMTKNKGAVGVQLVEGPGGLPTSRARVACLASGGYHSSLVAWRSVLSGYSVTLVHARSDDESLRQVGRLYAELSRRADSSRLALEVLDGRGGAGDRLASWLDGSKDEIVAGVHPECRGGTSRKAFAQFPSVLFPLLLLQEDEVMSGVDSLGLKVKAIDEEARLSMTSRREPFLTRTFGGRESDINGVLDSVLG